MQYQHAVFVDISSLTLLTRLYRRILEVQHDFKTFNLNSCCITCQIIVNLLKGLQNKKLQIYFISILLKVSLFLMKTFVFNINGFITKKCLNIFYIMQRIDPIAHNLYNYALTVYNTMSWILKKKINCFTHPYTIFYNLPT